VHELTDRFIDALHVLHRDRDAGPIAQLFSQDATLARADQRHTEEGPEGAERFWKAYREVFEDIESHFEHVVTDEKTAALEWVSRGTLKDGAPLEYRGVTVLVGGDDEGTISAARTYFDSGAFRPPAHA
jgi:ketosteroid isomerase-like protein